MKHQKRNLLPECLRELLGSLSIQEVTENQLSKSTNALHSSWKEDLMTTQAINREIQKLATDLLDAK